MVKIKSTGNKADRSSHDGEVKQVSVEDIVDRIVLKPMEGKKLQGWVEVLNQKFDGMIRVTKSDLANFLVREHAAELTEHEVGAIENNLYDEVRWLNWALSKIRKAKKEGTVLTLADLMLRRAPPMPKQTSPKKRERGTSAVSTNEQNSSVMDHNPEFGFSYGPKSD